jgi:pimeloyl-ACP methyl ester carboxylesterase
VLPGKQELDQLVGACSVASAPMSFTAPGQAVTGRFFSRARRQEVGYAIAYPPGHGPGSRLPLVIALHGFGATDVHVLSGLTPPQALALRTGGRPLPPMAMAAADGGGGYWHPHPGDNPMGMVIDELIPLCQRLGLGRPPYRIGTVGISMGGYGALLLAEKYPRLISAVAAVSPAVWTSYSQARAVNPGAFASAADFAANDVIRQASALRGVAVRVASGLDDPFHPGVLALASALPRGAVVDISGGCHTSPFFTAQVPPSLAFLARHLVSRSLAGRL